MGLSMRVYTKKIIITKKLVSQFRNLTKDKNPIHLDIKTANKYGYKKPIVYGFLSASFLSSIIGNDVPGPGSVWLDTNIQFASPVFENDEIIISSKILRISENSQLINLESIAKNQNSELIFKCYSTIKATKSFILKNLKKKSLKKIKIKEKKKIKTILIIGSSSKITSELTKKIINKYDKFIFIYHKTKPKKKNNKFIYFKHDLKKQYNSKNLYNYIKKKNCKIEAIISLASEKILFKDFFETKREEILDSVKVQTIGSCEIFQNLKQFILNSKPSIVFIGSEVLSSKPPKKMLAYVIGKYALLGLFRSISEEFGSEGIRVNMISPGIIDELSNSFPEISREMFKVNSSLGTLIKIRDVVNLILFLISDKSKNISGQNIRANAGYSFN